MRVEWFVYLLRELKLVKVVFQAKKMVIFLVEASYRESSRFQNFLAGVICKSLCCYLLSSQHLAQLVYTYFFPLYHLANGTLVSFYSYL